jgi:hypothetical protein
VLGIVFTELLEMVEDTFTPELADDVLSTASTRLESGGVYTAVGNYGHEEALVLVATLSEKTGIDPGDLVHAYGKHLFGRFFYRYPQFFEKISDSFQFLEGIENHIHREVLKLYPASELPHFVCERPDAKSLVLTYKSTRPFARLAHGLIEGCIAHFGEAVTVLRDDLDGGKMMAARFRLSMAD